MSERHRFFQMPELCFPKFIGFHPRYPSVLRQENITTIFEKFKTVEVKKFLQEYNDFNGKSFFYKVGLNLCERFKLFLILDGLTVTG